MVRILFLFALAALTAPGSPYSAVKQNDKHCRKKVVRNKVSISKLIRDAKIHNFFNPAQPYIKEDPNLKAIIGGSRALRKDYPWVSLLIIQKKGGISECTGVAINEVVMVTAAHCTPDYDDGYITVLMGFDDSDRARARHTSRIMTKVSKKDIYLHPQYTSSDHDIALFQYDVKPYLRAPMFGYYPYLNKDPDAKYSYKQQCTILGFGAVNLNLKSPKYLQKATVNIENTHFKAPRLRFSGTFQGGPCYGDSGAPIICTIRGQTMLVGLIIKTGAYCDIFNHLGTAVKISYNFEWIFWTFINLIPRGSMLNFTGSCPV